MELDEFVASVLTRITKGVSESADEIEKLGGVVNPKWLKGKEPLYRTGRGQRIHKIEFDVAVVTEDTTEGVGKVSVLGSGVLGGLSSKDTTVSRIRFSVGLALPLEGKAQDTEGRTTDG